jgi:hypothetical protein
MKRHEVELSEYRQASSNFDGGALAYFCVEAMRDWNITMSQGRNRGGGGGEVSPLIEWVAIEN